MSKSCTVALGMRGAYFPSKVRQGVIGDPAGCEAILGQLPSCGLLDEGGAGLGGPFTTAREWH